jgi:tetratricopeptide (TPR) repeat protein
VAEVIGGHYASALESAPALSADVEGLSRPDIEAFGALWFERGGETALGLAAHEAARSLFKRSLDLTAPDAALDRARRWERLGDATAYAGDMDEGGRALGESVDIYRTAMGHLGLSADARFTARDGYARALASLGWVWGQQLRFKDAAQLAEDGLRLMGEGDDIATARLLYLRARSVGLFQLQPEMREDLERALELTRRQGAATLEFEITQALHDLLIEDGKVGIDELIEHDRRVIDLARELERWQDVTRTLRMEAMMLAEERVAESWPRLDEAAEVAEAHGLREETAWIDYARAEAGFASGDWDRAWDAATRAIDIAERNAYHRAAVRTWFVLVAMALARGRRDVLEHAARWFDQYSELFPHSPYGELMHGAIDLRLAAAGIRESDGPSLDDVLAVWDETQILGSVWDASETVAQQWLARGALEDVRTWLDAMARWHDHPMTSNLGKGAHALIEARLHLAEGRRELASTLAGRAAETFRTCPAPWWLAKAIRLLEAAGTASPSLTTEGAQIEQALGVTAGRP